MALILAGSAQGQFSLLDDMENGDNWIGNGAVVTDPADAGNNVYAITYNTSVNESEGYLTLDPWLANNTTSTMFLRVRSTVTAENSFNWVFGTTTNQTPDNNWNLYNGYANLDDLTLGETTLNGRNGTGFEAVGPAAGDTWYNVWMVLDNTNDTTTFYYNTGPGKSATDPSTLSAGPWAFRNAANFGLKSLYLRNNQNGTTGYIDDVWLDPSGENLSNPSVILDTDGDGMPDSFEELYTDPPSPTALVPTDDLEEGGSGDGLDNLLEFQNGTNPLISDSDGDTLTDGAEVNGTSNAFASRTPTDPTKADSDGDGADDFEENGSLNVGFANAPTNPNETDTDGDGMPDGYELANNNITPTNTALDPNDDGSLDDSQSPDGDRDGDTLINISEFDPSLGININSPQTRADLADTDGDGLSDLAEDNYYAIDPENAWAGANQTGTNPAVTDTDGDGIDDGMEILGDSYPGAGVYPTNSNPNLVDTDGDDWTDKYEADLGFDPNDALSTPVQADTFTLVENFESEEMIIGETFDGVNGWTVALPDGGLVADEPIAGSDRVGALVRVTSSNLPIPISRSLGELGLQILDGNTGTLFMQVYTGSSGSNISYGLSDVPAPANGGYGDFEAQAVTFNGRIINVRDGADFRNQSIYQIGQWSNIWIVATNGTGDNTVPDTDTVKVYWESPYGETGQIDLTDDLDPNAPFAFRNGTADALGTLLMIVANAAVGDSMSYIDNIHINPTKADLSVPAGIAAKPMASFPGPLVIESSAIIGANFEMVVSGLDPNKSYDMLRSFDLANFPDLVDTASPPQGTTSTFTAIDATTESTKAFYKVTEQ